jgi:DICT domain-containing protein
MVRIRKEPRHHKSYDELVADNSILKDEVAALRAQLTGTIEAKNDAEALRQLALRQLALAEKARDEYIHRLDELEDKYSSLEHDRYGGYADKIAELETIIADRNSEVAALRDELREAKV